MPAPHFDYLAPTTVDEAVAALVKGGKDARVMAGGTDLMVKIRHRALFPKQLISLKRIDGLDAITFDEKSGLTIGATALLADVASHPMIRKHYPTVAEAAESTANVQVRNMGTVVGNLCNASPSADNAPTLIALNATVNITGPNGTRSMPLDEFFRGPGITALEIGEIVTSIVVPTPPAHTGTAYISISQRGQLDCSAIGLGARVTMDGNRCTDVRIVVGACAPIPLRTKAAEKMLVGQELTDDLIRQAAQKASDETSPITDVRASAEYRQKVTTVIAIRALIDARKMAKRKK
ncbi:dehydrogenase [Desulfosarcina ovata subsp. sediminis]|uniref:Dehydrogenase n=1 Tax=Desulfosarcina ovata subsp. sediminis TaxID=885957 RepID=A0A5K7ZRL0_9BACT|nr:FAD binding domain-containing protein [Desulfosarcina ovata]BBO81993.1 dehydrogenase [Desulfosarcina ovata subsp. sediminis]